MNPAWKQYLSNLNAAFSADNSVTFVTQPIAGQQQGHITPLSQLAVLRVSGQDATAFLQGQTTCNFNELNGQLSSFGAFCNAKGRVITTFLALQHQQAWLLILPTDLLPSLQKRLQLYILRAKVQLSDASGDYCLLGLDHLPANPTPLALPQKPLAILAQAAICVRLGEQQPRYLVLADCQAAQQLWLALTEQGCKPQDSTDWNLLDIQAGIPWLCASTSEEYIPQMLNLDQLGGISFNKGCYTGQEIVARTHYLGKAKRAMFTATAELSGAAPELNSNILDAPNGQVVGTVLATHVKNNCCTLLVILATDACHSTTLTLQEHPSIQIKLA
jgi:tRNA-modifying protein YgfZ